MPSALVVLLMLSLTALTAAASPSDEYRRAWQPYTSQLRLQCPSKRLELLAPADLRDALDKYETHLPPSARQAISRTEANDCAHVIAGASCSNLADIQVAIRSGNVAPLAGSVCNQFEMCRAQSDCDPASAEGLIRDVRHRGARLVVQSFTEAKWDMALDEAAEGRADWLQLVAALRPATDGSLTERIDKSLSEALRSNPAEVLQLMRIDPDLPRTTWICQDRMIEPSKAELRSFTQSAIAAVGNVRDPQLRSLQESCLASLKRS